MGDRAENESIKKYELEKPECIDDNTFRESDVYCFFSPLLVGLSSSEQLFSGMPVLTTLTSGKYTDA